MAEYKDRTDTITLDLDDRRRLAVTEVVIAAEQNGGMLTPHLIGTAVLHNVLPGENGEPNTDDTIALSDAANARLVKMIQRGY